VTEAESNPRRSDSEPFFLPAPPRVRDQEYSGIHNIRASAASVKAGAMGAGAAQQRLAASVTDKLGGCMR